MRMVAMSGDDPHDQIEDLETQIEDLAATAERCRKIILFGKAVIAAGGVLLLAAVLDPSRFGATVMIGAIAAVLGGIVLFGSNRSTLERAIDEMKSAEQQRAELIGQTALRVVSTS